MDIAATCTKQFTDDIKLRKISNWTYAITLPMLDRKIDLIEIYLLDCGNGMYRLCDDGETINELAFNGIDVVSDVVKAHIKDIAKDYGIEIICGTCYMQVDEQRIAYRIQKFVSGLLQISSIYYFRDLLSEVE